jgi:hypothetical protein
MSFPVRTWFFRQFAPVEWGDQPSPRRMNRCFLNLGLDQSWACRGRLPLALGAVATGEASVGTGPARSGVQPISNRSLAGQATTADDARRQPFRQVRWPSRFTPEHLLVAGAAAASLKPVLLLQAARGWTC